MTDSERIRKLEAELLRLMARVEKLEREIGKLPLRISTQAGGSGDPVWTEYTGP